MCPQALVTTETAGLGYMDVLRMLTGPVYAQSSALGHKQAYCSIAKCVAALTTACPREGPAVVGQFIQVPFCLSVCLSDQLSAVVRCAGLCWNLLCSDWSSCYVLIGRLAVF